MRQCDISCNFFTYVSHDWRLRHVRGPHDEEGPSDLRLSHAGSLLGVRLKHSLHEAVARLEGNVVQIREPEVRGRRETMYLFLYQYHKFLCFFRNLFLRYIFVSLPGEMKQSIHSGLSRSFPALDLTRLRATV